MAHIDKGDNELELVRSRKEQLRKKIDEIKRRADSWSELSEADWRELKALCETNTAEEAIPEKQNWELYKQELRSNRSNLRLLKQRRVGAVIPRTGERREDVQRRERSIDAAGFFVERRSGLGDRRTPDGNDRRSSNR